MTLPATKTRQRFVVALMLVSNAIAAFASNFAFGATPDSRLAIERAVLHIELADYALARSYLERPLIDPRITVTERSRAYYLQGYSLELGGFHISAAQNYAKALAFNADNPATLAALGHLYAKGLGVQQDQLQANDLLRRSAQLGHAPGMTRLGAWLLSGLSSSSTPKDDLDEARLWLTKAAEVDDAEALLFLALSYRASHTANPDPQQALNYYEQALVLNEPAAFNSIGHMHLRGEFGKPRGQAAVTAFTRGAQALDAPAQVSLGYLYLMGNQVALDHPKATALFQQAAQAGDSRAHHYLGYLAETSDPESADAEQQAIKHYQQAAVARHPASLKRLSELAFANNEPAAGIRYLRSFVSTTSSERAQHWRANHLLAWLLATHRDPALRDGEAALQLAQASVANDRSAATLDTLAAAYAETRDFTAAVTTQNEALAMLDVEAQRTDYADRLLAYEQQQPWREGSDEDSTQDPHGTVAPK